MCKEKTRSFKKKIFLLLYNLKINTLFPQKTRSLWQHCSPVQQIPKKYFWKFLQTSILSFTPRSKTFLKMLLWDFWQFEQPPIFHKLTFHQNTPFWNNGIFHSQLTVLLSNAFLERLRMYSYHIQLRGRSNIWFLHSEALNFR